MRARLLRALSQTAICYPRSAIVGKGAGRQAPTLAIAEKSMGWHLLIYPGSQNIDLSCFKFSWLYPVLMPARPEGEGFCLVRPDLYVAYQANDLNLDRLSQHLAFFMA